MKEISIGEFARRSRLSLKALRLYDKRGVLVPSRVDQASGYRYYDTAQLDDARLVVMAALTVCDELLDTGPRIRKLEEELEALRGVRTAAADRARATQVAVANALNSAADRIERTTQVLNRTIGGGVAIG